MEDSQNPTSSAIMTLFGADYWWNKEVLHQMVLSILFDHTDLSQRLGGESCCLVESSSAEVGERRAFDLQLPIIGNRKINLELKLNAALSERQIIRQKLATQPDDAMWYVLLGASAHCWRIESLQKHCPEARRIDLPELLDALASCKPNTGADPGIVQLHQAYSARLKQHTSLVYESFSFKPLAQWGYHEWAAFYGAYEQRKWQLHKSMESGNFWVCGVVWEYIDENVDVALELEQNTGLCFKIQVKKPEARTYLRNLWYNCLHQAGGEKVQRPKHFGSGGWMTGAVYRYNADLIRHKPVGPDASPPYPVDWDYFQASCDEATCILHQAAALLKTALNPIH